MLFLFQRRKDVVLVVQQDEFDTMNLYSLLDDLDYIKLHSEFIDNYEYIIFSENPDLEINQLSLIEKERFYFTRFLTKLQSGGVLAYFFGPEGNGWKYVHDLLIKLECVETLKSLNCALSVFPTAPKSNYYERIAQFNGFGDEILDVVEECEAVFDFDLCSKFMGYYMESSK